MRDGWIKPDAVFDGVTFRKGCAMRIEAGHVAELSETNMDDALPRTGIATPGFVDLQVNGGGGLLVNTSPTPEGFSAIAAAHRGLGTVGILPTVITDAPEVLARAVDAAMSATGQKGILGLHIEGPHIAPARRGTHAERFIRPLDATTLNHVERLRSAGVAVMITLAPEAATPEQIAKLAAMGAVVSLGHSNATAKETDTALAAGARCFTHLFNAMSPMQGRAPGMVGAAINSNSYAGIIADGIHVDDSMLSLACRARPVAGRMFLVSDAMPTVGGPDRFTLYGSELRVAGGRLVNAEGNLAGAHLSMADAVARMAGLVGTQEALRMAITIPRELMGFNAATISGLALDKVVWVG